MKAEELDAVYAELCRAMRDVEPEEVEHYLARLVVLLFARSDDREAVSISIRDALLREVEHP